MYKYGEAKWIDLLTSRGCIRIGTLHDFRRMEHKGGIADQYEGTKSLHHQIDTPTTLIGGSPESNALLEAFGFGNLKPGGEMKIENVNFLRRIESPDFFIFCLATRFSTSVLAEFQGSNACARITHVRRFVQALSDALSSRCAVQFVGIFPVLYSGRAEAWNGADMGTHPAIIKGKEFAGQFEVRALWRPLQNLPISPQNIEVSDVNRYCERIL